jgi:hypothetical protein
MKVQMAIVANAKEERGRSLVGVLLKNGAPVLTSGQPHWLRPVIELGKPNIPTAMVVDLMALDVVEVDLAAGANLDEIGGQVEVDFYSLQIKGRMSMESLLGCCDISSAFGIWDEAWDELGHGATTFGTSLCMILACQCAVIHHKDGPEVAKTELKFGYNGAFFQFPVVDPRFLELLDTSGTTVVEQASVKIVLAQRKGRKATEVNFRIVSVLL